jgi:hypothetical protein
VSAEHKADEPTNDECLDTPKEARDKPKRSPEEQKLLDFLLREQAQAFQDG